MGGFIGSMFEFLAALVAFALMLAVVAFGFRTSERAVKGHESAKRSRDNAPRSGAAPQGTLR